MMPGLSTCFIVAAMPRHPAPPGEYHYYHLAEPQKLRGWLSHHFQTSVSEAIDHKKRPVAFLFHQDLDFDDTPASLQKALDAKLDEIREITLAGMGNRQKLHIRVKDVYAMELERYGVKVTSRMIDGPEAP